MALTLFSANDGINGQELWVTDGTTAGTTLLKDINPGVGSSSPSGFTAFGGKVVFQATTALGGNELWITDGTAAGTVLLKDIAVGATGSNPVGFQVLGNKLVFAADDGTHGQETWVTDGTPAGTQLLVDAAPPSWPFGPMSFTALGNQLIFDHFDAANGQELWTTDGTVAGTHLLADLVPGTFGSGPFDFHQLGSKLIFVAGTAAVNQNTTELWVTDGTTTGTQLLKDINPLGASFPTNFTPLGNSLIFSATNAANGNELWTTDGTTGGTQLLKDIRVGSGGSAPFQFTALGNKLMFTAASTIAAGYELWITDGTAAGTLLVPGVVPGGDPGLLTAVGDKIVFLAYSANGDREPWVTDGTALGTHVLKDINPGPGSSSAPTQAFVPFGNKLVFVAGNSATGTEMWITDGTTVGTTLLKDIAPGAAASFPSIPKVVGSLIYFTANDGMHGIETWVSDGTPAGTVLLKDIAPGTSNSNSGGFFEFPANPNAPTNIALSSSTIQEFRANGTVVGNLTTTDPNAGDTFTYALLNNAGGRFSIVGNQLKVANGLLLDFEQASSHTISVQVTDSTNNTFTKSLTITVGDVNPEVVVGDAAANIIFGGALGDNLSGLGGADTLRGNGGDDILDGGADVDTYIGGMGNDAYYVRNLGLDGRVEDNFSELANQGTDGVQTTVTVNLNEARFANIENAYVIGTAAANLGGSAVNNVLVGNDAANSIYGLGGRDIMRGGLGADKFVYLSNADTGKTALTRDLIQDFTHLTDKIDLSALDANGAIAGNGTFSLLPAVNAAFTGVAGQLHYFTSAGNTLIEGDFNGDKIADFQIELTGLKTLAGTDFVL